VNLFSKLGLATKLVEVLEENQILKPTEIQEKTIPILLHGSEDFVGIGKTGTGKTLAFGLPLLNLIDSKTNVLQGLIIAPTRELGQQIMQTLSDYAKAFPDLKIASALGGAPMKSQIKELKSGAHLVVATPGRLLDLVKQEVLTLSKVQYLVLDEADEMLTGLKEDFVEIHSFLPKQRRTWLFTATMASEVKNIVHNYMSKNLIEIQVDMEQVGNSEIEHQYVLVNPIEKFEVLAHFLNEQEGQQGIIFCRTKAAVNKLAKNLAISKFSSGALHGSLAQPIRDRIMEQFREGNISILVATDLAARGIDVKDLAYVVNYHLPEVQETYVHRSGRTARAGATGLSLTIIQEEELKEMAEFQLGLGLHFIERTKPSAESVEENNTLLWAKRVFKTKINHSMTPTFKTKVHSIFQHLSKEELIDKLLSNQLLQTKAEAPTTDKVVKKKKKKR
jgi:ATP-dependent RNA helicase DeaD